MEIQLQPHSITALCAPHAARDEATLLIAQLALRGPVTVLDGGNRFAGYLLMQLLCRYLQDPLPAIRRVFVQRAFTCYQMQSMLDQTPSRPQPTILLDLLATFYDENVPLPEASRLLADALRQVERLSRSAPVLLTLKPPPSPERLCLVERAYAASQVVYTLETPPAPQPQLALFS